MTFNGSNVMQVIDTATPSLVQAIATGVNPVGVTVSPNGQTVYVANTLIALAGATLGANANCVFPVTVTGTTAGTKNNTTSPLTSNEAPPSGTAAANLDVVAPPTIGKAFGAASLGLGGTTTLTGNVTSTNGGSGTSATASLPVLAPTLAITKTHADTFTQGQTGSSSLTVSNAGAGPTAGPVTVVDTLPAGLTATALSGSGWTCTLATLTCTRSDAPAAGASYPPITLAVSIAATDPTALAAAPIPTLSEWAQALLVVLVLLSGQLFLRRRPA